MVTRLLLRDVRARTVALESRFRHDGRGSDASRSMRASTNPTFRAREDRLEPSKFAERLTDRRDGSCLDRDSRRNDGGSCVHEATDIASMLAMSVASCTQDPPSLRRLSLSRHDPSRRSVSRSANFDGSRRSSRARKVGFVLARMLRDASLPRPSCRNLDSRATVRARTSRNKSRVTIACRLGNSHLRKKIGRT